MPARFFYHDPSAPQPNQSMRIGVVALIEHGHQLLMELRSDSDYWALIGGSIEPDESAANAVIREVREETGLEVQDVKLFGIFSDPSRIASYPDGNVFRIVTIAFHVRVMTTEGMRASHESRLVRFQPFSALTNIDVPPTHRHILERYLADRNDVVLD